MPEFPRANSERSLTTQQPSVLAAPDTKGQRLEAVSTAAQQVQDTAFKWIDAVDTIQSTTAKANFKSGLTDVLDRASADPDFNNSDQYLKEIEKLRTQNLKGFASKGAESRAALDLGYEADNAKSQIKNLYRKKMIEVGQVSAMKLLDMEVKSPAAGFEERISSILNTQVKAGVFGQKDAYELQQRYEKQAKYNNFLNDMNVSPAIAEENLNKNEYGFDIRELSSARDVFDKQIKETQAVTQNEIFMAYLNGEELNAQAIKGLMSEKKITPNFAESLIDKIENPKPDTASKDAAYIEYQNIIGDLAEKGDKAEIGEIVNVIGDVMKQHAKGLLDTSDTKKIIKVQDELLQKKLSKQAEQIVKQTKPKTWLDRINIFTDKYAKDKTDIKARMYRELIDGALAGKDPDKVLQEITDRELGLQLAENLQKPDRLYADNPETGQAVYSDDGGATWFDEKTGKEIK